MSISANFPNVFPSLELNFAQSQQLDPRVTFSRSTTAPYYDGKTSVLAEQNLVLQSQNAFNGANWTKTSCTATDASTIAPDGTTTASTLTGTAGGYTQYISPTNATSLGISSASTVTNTYSLHLKAGTISSVKFLIYNNTGGNQIFGTFDLTAITGVAGGTAMTPTVTIVDVGNSWRRVTVTGNLGGSVGQFAIPVIYADNGTFYMWGIQVEQRSSVTAYNATTTSAITNYIPQLLTAPINQPRFDFNPTTGESLGLLIEQSSTNLVLWSQDFSNAAWAKANATVTTTAGIAPDGTQTAQLLVENSSYGSHGVSQAITVTSSQSYTQTIYAKAKDRTWIVMQPANNIPNCLAYFNLGTGAIGTLTNCTATITSVGNGWYKCSATFTNANSTQTQGVYLATGDGGATYTGNGYSGVYIWGMQFENLAFPTSYIPTTSAQVTRAADVANMTGTNLTSVWGSNSGTLYSSAKQYSTSVATYVQVSGSTAYTPAIGVYGSSSNSGVNGAFSISTSAYSANVINKTAFSFSFGNYLLCLNGGSVGTSASTTTLSIPTSLGIGSNGGANYLNGWLQKISLYPQVFTSTQLQALTGS